MRKLLLGLFITGLIGSSTSAFALTATWNKNAESDMKDYGVYMCFTKGCPVLKSAATLQGYVNHSATVNPSYPIPPNVEGTVAVTARDSSGNESGLSVPAFFDLVAPPAPLNLTVQ